jgi:hypothetical protein
VKKYLRKNPDKGGRPASLRKLISLTVLEKYLRLKKKQVFALPVSDVLKKFGR